MITANFKTSFRNVSIKLTCIFLLIGWSISSSADDDNAFRITKAEWKAERSELKIEGKGHAGATVEVQDADTLMELGSPIVDHDGEWKLKLQNIAFVPPRIQAISGGLIQEKTVKNADQTIFEITKAEWKAEDSELRIEGKGYAGAVVVVQNAATLMELGSPIVDYDGEWKLRLNDLYSIPCVIQAESGNRIQQQTVKNTPSDCNSVEPPTFVLVGLVLSGPDSVPENTAADYTATATFSDGSTQTATELTNWQLDNSTFASIDGGGVLTALEVSEDQTDTIIASYTHEGITKETRASVTIADLPDSLTGSHAGRFAAYEGTQTCLDCHTDQAMEIHGSVHYQWKGDASETVGLIAGDAGKLGGINDFCIYPDINWIGKLITVTDAEVDGGCAKCHVGLGAKPETQATRSQLENIDCLLCHSNVYTRRVERVNDNYRFVPDIANMSVSILQAASEITRPSKGTCLNCHTKAGGGNNFKRGDIEEYHRDPTRDFDVHMASRTNGGAGLDCLDCHTTTAHRIAGRGSDLRPRDLADPVNCENCHSTELHANSDINKHTARVNCTVCHIPYFAKMAPTDIFRDWSEPGVLDQEKGLYEPFHLKGTSLIPTYKFFNGLSYFYQFGDPAIPGKNGRVVMSAPEGSNREPGAKIYAFKHHIASQPVEPNNGRLLPLKIGMFFQTGEIDAAVAAGAQGVQWSYNGHEFTDTERFMGLFHEVAPKEDALSCSDCHDGGTRLDFVALGYTPNAIYNSKPLCASCHGDKSDKWSAEEYFSKLHQKHVEDKGYDCSGCHIFTAANN